mmetsp:Transcript_33569/g.81149  ORF Transcript_33569/g.81149 Transcript_33569/m.81149 type:complete len:122 (+) Transcript_33569:2-367(+)
MSQAAFVQMVSQNKNPTPTYDPSVVLNADEVARHNTRYDCWTIYRGIVYDVTSYLPYHPGGKGEMMKGAGKDCTELFNQAHSWVNAELLLEKVRLGPLVGKPRKAGPVADHSGEESSEEPS